MRTNQELTISPTLEACVDSLESAILAEQRGAHRLELCANLHLDGTTPDPDLIRAVLAAVRIPVKVMIRPRGGDFVYSTDDFNEMLKSVEICKTLGVEEIVSGILHSDSSLDIDRIKTLTAVASPMEVTIHKCIDLVPDVFNAIEQLKRIPGISGILSSGQASTAIQGADKLREMLRACESHISLIVAGRVTQENLKELISVIGAKEYHGRRIV